VRVYHQREAELQARVDRARVRIVHANARERRRAIQSYRTFAAEVAAFDAPVAAVLPEPDAECEPVPFTGKRRR
jgi:hypothetical protein